MDSPLIVALKSPWGKNKTRQTDSCRQHLVYYNAHVWSNNALHEYRVSFVYRLTPVIVPSPNPLSKSLLQTLRHCVHCLVDCLSLKSLSLCSNNNLIDWKVQLDYWVEQKPDTLLW